MEDGRGGSPVLNVAILYARSSILVTILSEMVDIRYRGQKGGNEKFADVRISRDGQEMGACF